MGCRGLRERETNIGRDKKIKVGVREPWAHRRRSQQSVNLNRGGSKSVSALINI